MRSGRFVDLYVSETGEHLQLLTRSILSLERGDASAIEDAFRAAHTIKGLAAAMGHGRAAEEAHSLEDRLSRIREGEAVDRGLADALLQAADSLESAIEAALNGGDAETTVAEEAHPAAGPAVPQRAPSGPPGTASVLVIRLAAGAALPEARVELIRKVVDGDAAVLGLWPEPGSPFPGEARVFVTADADPAALETKIRRTGDVDSVTVRAPTSGDVSAEPSGMPRVASGSPDRRTPERSGSSVRVERARLDEMAEGIAELSVLHARAAQTPDALTSHRAAAVLASLQRTILELRMVPLSTALDRLGRLVRDAARSADKEVDLEVSGGDIELDQVVLDALVDPLVHLLRNAVDHGIECVADREAAGKPGRGRIHIEVVRERNSVRMRVSDDGRGIDVEAVASRGRDAGLLAASEAAPGQDEILRLVFQPGFSTASSVTELSGRGVGLDVVAGRIRGLGGAIEVSTAAGRGSTFTLRVPVTLALAHSLRIGVGQEEYALPITHVSEVVPLSEASMAAGTVNVRGEPVSLVDLGRVLGAGEGKRTAAVVAELAERRVALAVDRVIGHEQIVVKTFDAPVGALPVFSGATILADGRPALLIDPLSVI